MIPTTVPVEGLLQHMARHYSDWHIVHELDAVLDACSDQGAYRIVEAYAAARAAAPGFSPRTFERARRHNSHEPAMFDLARRGARVRPDEDGPRCEHCGAPFRSRRETAQYCSARCRVRAARSRAVTLTSGPGTLVPPLVDAP